MGRWWMLAVGLCVLATSHAAPTPIARVEIDYLLSVIAGSGCEFYRNGSWYDGKSAAAHLRSKYENLAAKDLIRDSADFIERAATRSSVSGRAYAIKCPGTAAVPSHDWLTNLLIQYRASHKDALEGLP